MRFTGSVYPAIFFYLLIALSYLAYLPGLSGDFLFDDFPNLQPMGDLGGVTNWETFTSFVLSGFAGPTGRPISLASFLLDDNTWPSQAIWFKQTNILIHLLCGVMLCWAVLLLLRNMKTVSERQAQWISVLACACWLLHPYMVSTTLYVVQRMAQLATLFCLSGIVMYLYGRLQLTARPKFAYLLMTVAVGLMTLLAAFSKENGALLPLLILVIEFSLSKNDEKPLWQWRAAFLWLPSMAIFMLLARYIDFSENPWPSRGFNQVERLFTEARILCEYLVHIFVPRVEGNGLYQDGYEISHGLFDPLSTFFSVLFILFLLFFAFLLRIRAPLIFLAVLFFFAAHLMESTVVGLELYFEHRNHLASIFLFLPLAYYCIFFAGRYKFLPAVAVVVICLLGGITWLRASLWGNGEKLELYWVQSAQDSPRAINSMAAYYMQNGKFEEANSYIFEQSKRLPESSLLSARLLLQKVYLGAASEHDFTWTAQRLRSQRFDAQTVQAVRMLVDEVLDKHSESYMNYTLILLTSMSSSPVYGELPLFTRLLPYLRARLYLGLSRPDQAYESYISAMWRYRQVDSCLAMVSEMASAGYPSKALQLLDIATEVLKGQESRKLKRSRESYERDIAYLRNVLQDDLATVNAAKDAG